MYKNVLKESEIHEAPEGKCFKLNSHGEIEEVEKVEFEGQIPIVV